MIRGHYDGNDARPSGLNPKLIDILEYLIRNKRFAVRSKTLIRAFFVGLVLAPYTLVAEIAVERLDIDQPRLFGYRIGDKFERSIVLRLRKPYQLKTDSLPESGRLTEWLAIESPRIDQKNMAGATEYHIQLTYQIVNINPEVRDIAIPHQDLLYIAGSETSAVLVPATRVNVSVLRDPTKKDLQPDRAPLLLQQRYFTMAVFGTLLLCALIGLVALYWGLPFVSKDHPFAEAYRSLRKLRRRTWDDDSYRESLQNVHRAFNETTGKTVFAEGLGGFFNDHRQYAPLELSIEDYFARSRKYFFEGAEDDQSTRYSLAELLALVRSCRKVERGLS